MTTSVKVLFTKEHQNWRDGCEHVIDGGIWCRLFVADGKRRAKLYCRDKTVLAEFADMFSMRKFSADVEIFGFGYYLSVFAVDVFGKKLDELHRWKRSTGVPEVAG